MRFTIDLANTQPRDGTKLDEIRQQSKKIADDRGKFVESLKDDDLNRPITAQPEPGKTLKFPLGQTILEVCNNATHHRAHAINMLRRVGIATDPTDLSRMKRQAV